MRAMVIGTLVVAFSELPRRGRLAIATAHGAQGGRQRLSTDEAAGPPGVAGSTPVSNLRTILSCWSRRQRFPDLAIVPGRAPWLCCSPALNLRRRYE
jgi:hypothetical protein